jgi:uncharacterized membrane protein (UPF0136 family)
MPTLLQRLKERKLVQWAVAYLAGAFVVFQGVEVMAEPWGISPALQRSIHVLLLIGLFITLVLAWYHGEKGQHRVGGFELLLLAALLVIGGFSLRFITTRGEETAIQTSLEAVQDLPLVIIMDSPHPTRVYDEEIRAANGTNADVVSDILLDLPIRRQKEAIGPEWHRDQEILSFNPDLIIIHFSGFRQDMVGDAPRDRFKLFIQFFAETDTEFLVYSRRTNTRLKEDVIELLGDLEEEHPGLLQRVRTFGVLDYGRPQWLDPATAAHLKLAVKEMLSLE